MSSPSTASAPRLRTAWTFARRELRGGLRSFRVFLTCLALGVAGIAGVGSVVAAIEAGLAREGQALLGGDVEIELTYRFAEPAERADMEALGTVSETVDFRGMARTAPAAGEAVDSALVQVKAVDGAYPLYGEMLLDPPVPLSEALRRDAEGRAGVVAERALLTRLGLSVGDPVRLGEGVFEVRAAIEKEPDRAAGGFEFGPRFMISTEALPDTDLVKPGTLYETEYRIRFDEPRALGPLRAELLAKHQDAGWRWRDRRDGAPAVRRFVDRLGAFLTLVGLAALAVGGVGVGASVRNYLEGKTETIATLKTLGADGPTIVWTYLLQIAVLAAAGIAIGLGLGALIPIAFAPLLAESLPVPAAFGVYPAPLAEAALYGTLAAFMFALWPLARAREVRAAGLFRDLVSPARATPRPSYLLAIAGLGAAAAAAAMVFTGQWMLAGGFVGGVAGALLLLALAAEGIGAVSRSLARSGIARNRLPLRLALGGVGGPGGETRGAVLALGLGLTVLTAIGLVDSNLRRLVDDTLPERAPAYFFVDIQNADLESFRGTALEQPGVTRIETAPMLRGVITRINGMSAREWREQGRVADGFGWILRGDRGVTYAATPPVGTAITEGDWWPADYQGEPLVSFGDEQARGLGVGIGDTITVNVFGRDITARIASLRRVEFRQMGINFLMVFDPGVLRGAPHTHIATLYGEEPVEGAYLRTVANDYPAVTAVRVEDALEVIAGALRDVATAARVGASATLITGLVVLIGAAAAGQRRQIYEAAVLKTLGATRGSILAAMTLRAALLGLAASVVAIGAGTLAAWAVSVYVMDAGFAFDGATAALVIVGGVIATLIASAAFAFGPLSARPARVLRARE